ncbi:MAG: hypothetical protein EZS28_034955 [Streblomastix strix]|uniref:Uncharacterized protein n=1 Tax=Streblomastix strix TaxID=222440 RepID=A0A5J4UG21_9EUKA|nr:MAG: hypothetical protein EZS28_034955 [Streblomastix strix]
MLQFLIEGEARQHFDEMLEFVKVVLDGYVQTMRSTITVQHPFVPPFVTFFPRSESKLNGITPQQPIHMRLLRICADILSASILIINPITANEPWKSFLQTLSENVYYYVFTGNQSDLFATAFAFSYPGQQLMKSGSIGSVQPINKNIGLAFGKPEYISEILPVSLPKIDLQQIPLDEKMDHTQDHKIQR